MGTARVGNHPALVPVRPDAPAQTSGSERKLTPATALLRVVRVENRPALRVRVGKTRSTHLDAAASRRAVENSKRTSGHSSNFPKQARGSPRSESRARENCQRSSGQEATYLKLVLDDIAPRELGTCFGSGIRKFEAGYGKLIRIERTNDRRVLRVGSRNMSAIPRNRVLGRASGKSTRFLVPQELAIARRSPRSGPMLLPKHRGRSAS